MYKRNILLSSLFILVFQFAYSQGESLRLINSESGKELFIKKNKNLLIKTADDEKISGKFKTLRNDFLILENDSIAVSEIVWFRKKSVQKPIGLVLTTGGSALFLFGAAGWASSVGSDDTWASLGAVVGALFAISGGIVDAVSIPMLVKTRRYYLSGEKEKWQILLSE